jgi:hypothetical protein
MSAAIKTAAALVLPLSGQRQRQYNSFQKLRVNCQQPASACLLSSSQQWGSLPNDNDQEPLAFFSSST